MLRSLAVRSGLFAVGAIYVALGIVSFRVALLGAKDLGAGVPGALAYLLARPHGERLLATVVAGLAAICVVRALEALQRRFRAWTRAGLVLSAVGYATLAWTAARLLFHVRRGGGSLEKAGAAWLIGEPFGAGALTVVGAAVVLGGAFEAWQGLRGRPEFSRKLLPRPVARGLVAIGRFGLVARGSVLVVLGYFVVRAGRELDPGGVRGIEGVLGAFSRTALGPLCTGVAALGLAAYGVHMWTLALLRRKV